MPTPPPGPYLQHLPEIFRTPPGPDESPFLGQFLNLFEALLSGRSDALLSTSGGQVKVRGLEEILKSFVHELDPAFTTVAMSPDGTRFDSPFLTYLASWVALTLDQNWDLDRKRRWLQRIVVLYQRRGTLAGMEEYLAMFVGSRAKISEPAGGLTLGVKALKSTTLGVDTFLAGGPAYYFRVGINYGFPEGIADTAAIPAEPFDITEWRNIRKGTRAIVDLEKPAHTYYTLDTRAPGIILGFKVGQMVGGHFVKGRATVARDTLIWQQSKPV